MSEELKPCPFCGSNDITQEFCNTPWRYIGCNQCEEEGPPADSHGEAVRLWNTRHITLDQAKHVLAEAGMVAVPIEDCTHAANTMGVRNSAEEAAHYRFMAIDDAAQ
jgi:Lar family restriction alleviation protein